MTTATGSVEQSIEQLANGDYYSATTVGRLLVTSRMLMEVDPKVQRQLADLLYLLDRGDIIVYKDLLTGDLKYKVKEIN